MNTTRMKLVWLATITVTAFASSSRAEVFPARIFSSTQAVAAVTVGDFDPTHAGKEIASVMADGSVVELALGASGWTASTIYVHEANTGDPWVPTLRVTLNVGDVLSEHAGQELVLSFQHQVVVVYYAPSTGWTHQVIRDAAGFATTTWGAESGDCDPAHPGEEVFAILEQGFDFSSGTVFGANHGAWESNEVYYGEVGMDAAIGDSNPDFTGNEIIVVTEMGPVYEITPPAGGRPGLWPRRTIWNDPENAGWVVKIGDVDPQTPGKEIVYGTRYSNRILISRHNGTNLHKVGVLLTGVNTNQLNSMLDIAIGQLFPASPSAEILGVDMSGSVYVVEQMTSRWQGSVLWQDSNALHAVAATDLFLRRATK